MHARNLLSFGILLIALSACRAPLKGAGTATPTPETYLTVTPTPFQPETSETALPIAAKATTPSPASTSSPTALTATSSAARIFPTPQITPASTGIPAPVDVLPQPRGQINILFMGSDELQNKDYRTEVNILVTLRPDGSVSLTSFPRDLYLYLPGKQMQRLSTVMELGGFDLVRLTFDYNFGFRPDDFILTDYGGYQAIIDKMNGIDVQVAKTYHAARDGYASGYTVNAGSVHMDGATALWYVRLRNTADDVDRMRRSQEVLVAMGEKLFSLDALAHITDIYDLFSKDVDTDLSLGKTINLLPRMLAADPKKVNRYFIGTAQTTPWTDPVTKAQYLLPTPEALRILLQQAIGIP